MQSAVQYYIVISGLSDPVAFLALFHKRRDFRKEVIVQKMCVLIFSTTFVWNIAHCKENSVRYYHKCTYAFV
jgi:hypothetical protein